MMRSIYNIITVLLTPLIYGWLQRRAARGKEDAERLRERFGYASVARPAGKMIWLHAASVGEAQSVLTLARNLLEQDASLHLLITTGTVTSAALIAQQKLPRSIHQFVPVDSYFAVRRFLQHWQPNLVLWVESEFWPQMLWQVQARNIPALLINARMSEKSMRGWQRFPGIFRSLLASFRGIYAGSAEDAKRLRILGADEVKEAGNLKFDAAPLPYDPAEFIQLQKNIGARPLWLAASTHPGEEMLVLEAHKKLTEDYPDLLTIIVPRHAIRGDAIAAEIAAQHLILAQRSKHQPITTQTGIYLADTMGELGLFYRLSPIVFIGGSLLPHGGHNPVEPALLDCAILTGPYTHNFAAMIALMQQANAMRVVADATELAQHIKQLLMQPELRQTLSKNVYAFVQSQRGATQAILQHIAACMEGA